MILAIETFKFIMQLKQKLVANQSAAKCWVESCIKEKCWWHCCKKIVVGWSYILSIWATSCISQQEKITQQEHKFYTQKRVFLLNYFYFLSYFLLLIFSWSGPKRHKSSDWRFSSSTSNNNVYMHEHQDKNICRLLVTDKQKW